MNTCGVCNLPVISSDGGLKSSLMIISEYPGDREMSAGKPFVGRAGDVLRDLLKGVGLSYHDFLVTNLWLHPKPQVGRSKDGKSILAAELEWHRKQMWDTIAAAPRTHLLLLGSDICRELLDANVTDVMGVPMKVAALPKVKIIAAPNPASLLYDDSRRGEVTLAIQKFARLVKG